MTTPYFSIFHLTLPVIIRNTYRYVEHANRQTLSITATELLSQMLFISFTQTNLKSLFRRLPSRLHARFSPVTTSESRILDEQNEEAKCLDVRYSFPANYRRAVSRSTGDEDRVPLNNNRILTRGKTDGIVSRLLGRFITRGVDLSPIQPPSRLNHFLVPFRFSRRRAGNKRGKRRESWRCQKPVLKLRGE